MRGPRPLAAALAAAASLAAAVALLACGKDDAPSSASVARAAWERFYRPPTDRVPKEKATNPGTPWGDWVGSLACRECHAGEHARWRDSYHSKTLYDAVAETVFGDFGAPTFEDARYAFTVTPWRTGERRGMRIRRNAGAAVEPDTYGMGVPREPEGSFEVLYAFGNRRHQPYVARDASGKHWILPVYWNDVTKRWMWCGWRPYVTACAHCHVTGVKSTPTPAPGGESLPMTQPPRWNLPPAEEGWAEGAVGCEVCHGPGRPHVEAVRRMGDAAYRAHLEAGGEPTIYDPGREKDPKVRQSQCDSCHDFFSESTVTWVPGPRGYDHVMGREPITRETARNASQFWPDGTNRNVCSMGSVFGTSLMSRKGVECRDCHDPHGTGDWADLVRPLEKNALCLGCHDAQFPDAKALEAHTRHPADGPGSLCHECHMRRDKRFSNGVTVMSAELHSHDFSSPTGDEPANGPGPTCNFCHQEKDAAWTKARLAEWKPLRAPLAPLRPGR